jgi:tRNA A-37 threonylcarbamoyl transferase component Bud32
MQADADDADVEAERLAFNARRARTSIPPLLIVLVLGTLYYARAIVAADPAQRRWTGIMLALAVVTIACVAATQAVLRRDAWRAGWAIEALGYWFIVWGAIASGNVQHSHPTIDFFVFMQFAVVLLLRPRVAALLVAEAVAIAVLGAYIVALQPDLMVRRSELLLAVAVGGFVIALARTNLASLHFDVTTRRLLERQQDQLAALNGSLAEQVRAQVQEIVARSRDVELLNAQLRERVRERSHELSLALARSVAQGGRDRGLAVGATLSGRFVLGECLGHGGMGAVYRAVDTATGEDVALKVIAAASADELDAMHRFLSEARASVRVNHPAVVSARHVDVAEGMLFMVFDLVEGEALDRVLAREGPFSPARVVRLGGELTAALATAHAAAVVHRDLKPANVMLEARTGAVRLLDFGISKLRDAVGPTAAPYETHRGAVLGTPAYMAPEQVVDASAVDDRCDVYAVGVVLYELLTGALPFDDADPVGRMYARLSREPRRLRSLMPSTPADLAALVHRCLARDPAERPSARELCAALADFAPLLHGPEWSIAGALADRSQQVTLDG